MKFIIRLISIQLVGSLFFAFPFSYIWANTDGIPNRESLQSGIQHEATTTFQNSTQEQNTTNTTNTGDNVTTSQETNSTEEADINNANTAVVNQNVHATANTGNNEASKNISIGGNAGMISTGDAAVNVGNVTAANANTTYINTDPQTTKQDNNTFNTGDRFSTYSNSTDHSLLAVQNNNKTYINQNVSTDVNTGNNKAEGNISIGGNAGMISTGDAITNVDFLVTANGNVVLVGGDSDGFGPGSGASIFLLNTGDDFRYDRVTNNAYSTRINNNNLARISQSCGTGCEVNTGNNHADRNIAFGHDAGTISTNDAVITIGLVADTNRNSTAVENNIQNPSTNSNTVNTGDNATINNAAETESSTEVSNSNTAEVNQDIVAYANTGKNTANRNISIGGNAGVIQTGNAIVNVILLVQANVNNTIMSLLNWVPHYK